LSVSRETNTLNSLSGDYLGCTSVTQNDQANFINALKSNWWIEEGPNVFRKGTWQITFDTSGWMELGTNETPRIIDIPVPATGPRDLTVWTVHLIEHLFQTNEKLESRINS